MNWDKPKDQGVRLDALAKWHDLSYLELTRALENYVGKGRSVTYQDYLNYCKLMDSPLGRALT